MAPGRTDISPNICPLPLTWILMQLVLGAGFLLCIQLRALPLVTCGIIGNTHSVHSREK